MLMDGRRKLNKNWLHFHERKIFELSRRAREWLHSQWTGPVFMAVGMNDPVLGSRVMQALRNDIRNCPEPYEHSKAGHFVQEWGEEIAKKALVALAG